MFKKVMFSIIKILVALVILVIAAGFILANINLLDIPSSVEYRVDEIRERWSRDNGPEVDGIDIDYSYFSPVENGASSNKKYPLIINMAGALEGLQEGFELIANVMPSWSTEKYQSKFTKGGAFFLIARAPEEDWLYWDSPKLTKSLKAAIDDFCRKNKKNIDKDNIHIIGWCLGGDGAINLASSYPGEYATVSIMCPSRAITENEAQALKNTPVWFTGCKTDSYSNYEKCTLKSYTRLSAVSNRPEDVRLTSYESAPDVPILETLPFIRNHNLWNNLSLDLTSTDPEYIGMETVDGNGKEIKNPSAISWLDSHVLSDGRENSIPREEKSLQYKIGYYTSAFRLSFKSGLMRLMLNSFTLFGWI